MKKKSVLFAIIAVAAVVLVICLWFIFKGNNNDVNNNSNINSGNITLDEFNVESNVQVEGDGTKVNVSEKINKDVIEVDEFELSNISLRYFDGMTNFLADVKNNSGVDYPEGAEMLITFYNSDGSEIYSVPVITSSLYAGSTSSISARTTVDCSGAEDIGISIVK